MTVAICFDNIWFYCSHSLHHQCVQRGDREFWIKINIFQFELRMMTYLTLSWIHIPAWFARSMCWQSSQLYQNQYIVNFSRSIYNKIGWIHIYIYNETSQIYDMCFASSLSHYKTQLEKLRLNLYHVRCATKSKMLKIMYSWWCHNMDSLSALPDLHNCTTKHLIK